MIRGLKVEKRLYRPRWLSVLIPVSGMILALVASGFFMYLLGVSPLKAFKEVIYSALGSKYGISETIVKAVPLALAGIAVLLSFKMIIWNIGAEGQIVIGALATTAVVRYMFIDDPIVMFILMILASCIAGGLWAAFAGYLKARWNVNEIITTLMLNYIAIHLMDHFVYGPWRDPASLGFPMTKPFPDAARLYQFADTRVHVGIIIAVILGLVFYWIFKNTRWGYEVRVIGENPRAADFAGINYVWNVVFVMFLSGAICGIAGMTEIAGLQGRLQSGFSGGFGYTAIIVAWLARLNPLSVLFVSFFMGILLVGGDTLQIVMRLPLSSTLVIQGLILFFLLGGEFFRRYRIKLITGKEQ
jgi:simple sugar transport system permease protein